MKNIRVFVLFTLAVILITSNTISVSADDAPGRQTASMNANGEITFGDGISAVTQPESINASEAESWQIEYSQSWELDSLSTASDWAVTDNNSSGYCWGDASGSDGAPVSDDAEWSIWPAADCINGDTPDALGYEYPNDINTDAKYGPFNLSAYPDAKLEFDYSSISETGVDFFCYFASGDDFNYEGECVSGGDGSWYHTTLPLTKFKGDPSVWIKFYFASDSSIVDFGPFVDNISIYGKQFYSFNSNAAQDGWILESKETSNKGGTLNATEKYLRVGDAKGDKQYKSILSFNTKALPDTAIITSADIRIRKYTNIGLPVLGTRIFSIKRPKYGTSPGLQLVDFQAGSNLVQSNTGFSYSEGGGWVVVPLSIDSFDYINLLGTTQFKFYYSTDDNDNNKNDYERWYSGNSLYPPRLIVHYVMP